MRNTLGGWMAGLWKCNVPVRLPRCSLCPHRNGSRNHTWLSRMCVSLFSVARVEQTETPEMLKTRNDSLSSGRKEKVGCSTKSCAVFSDSDFVNSRATLSKDVAGAMYSVEAGFL